MNIIMLALVVLIGSAGTLDHYIVPHPQEFETMEACRVSMNDEEFQKETLRFYKDMAGDALRMLKLNCFTDEEATAILEEFENRP